MARKPKNSELISALAAKIPSKRGPKPTTPQASTKSRVSKTFRLDGEILTTAQALAWKRGEQITVLIENFLLEYVKTSAGDLGDQSLQQLINEFIQDQKNRDRRN